MAASEKEIRRRLDSIRKEMKQERLDAMVIFSQVQTGYSSAVRYVSNYHLTTRKEYLVLPLSGNPVLILPTLGQQFNAKFHSWIKDVRCAGEGEAMIREVANELSKQGVAKGIIGIVGLINTMPHCDYELLVKDLPKATLRDGTALLERVRMVKSPEEIQMIQETAEIADGCYAKLLEVLRVGADEIAVMAEIHRFLAGRGVEDVLILTAKGRSIPGYIDHPGPYIFKEGDHYIFSVEISGPSGYWSQIGRPVCLKKTTSQYEEMFKVGKSAVDVGVGNLAPGKRIGELVAAVNQEVRKGGFKTGLWCGHGMGMDVGEAPGLFQESPVELKEGMVITIHPHVMSLDGKEGIFLGDTFVIEKGGARNLSRSVCELKIL